MYQITLHTIISTMTFYTDAKSKVQIHNEDFLNVFEKWKAPTVIVSDGPYGVKGFPGDLPNPTELGTWYRPFIEAWSQASTPQTTLWFWNTENGWANVHPLLVASGWEFVNCHIWDKGTAHIAGNVNSKTIRQFPIVTEVCVQYTRKPEFLVDGKKLEMKAWLRHEWSRTGLPFSKTNEACDVKDAATRKYFTKCHLWYFPPAEAFEKFSEYANRLGDPSGRPYFSIDYKLPLTKNEWSKMRAKFYCRHGVTNVWREPPLNGKERLKNGSKSIHFNQKPLKLMKLIIESSSDVGDTIWEPFGGLCSAAVASYKLNRFCYASEIDKGVFEDAIGRIRSFDLQPELVLQ